MQKKMKARWLHKTPVRHEFGSVSGERRGEGTECHQQSG